MSARAASRLATLGFTESKRPGVQVHMAGDVVDRVLAGGREGVQGARRLREPS